MDSRFAIGMVLGGSCVLAGLGVGTLARAAQDVASPLMTADEAAIDRIIADLYASISGPVAQERNWDAFDSVFTQDARLAAWFPQLDGSVAEMKMTPSEYKERSGPMLVASGFSETEVNRELDVYGSIAHAFSTYRGEYTDARGEPRAIAGINSIQLVKTNDGWRVHSLIWQQAGDALPIPERYLGADR